MTCKAVVVTSNCVITKQSSLLLERKCSFCARLFKLKTVNFVAINGNRCVQQESSVSRKFSKEIVLFQQAHVRIPNLECDVNDSIGLTESDKKSDS